MMKPCLCWFFTFAFTWLLTTCRGHFNLFLNTTETKRLLGIEGEVFYVRAGIINDYALSFNLQVHADIVDIFFSWQNLGRSPPDLVMVYGLSLSVSNSQAMSQLRTSIDPVGTVPTTLSAFYVSLPCSGLVAADVDIKIFLNVSIRTNITTLELRRRKTCSKEVQLLPENVIDKAVPIEAWRDGHLTSETSSMGEPVAASSSHVFYIGIGCACGGIMVIALSIFVYYVQAKKSTSERLSDISSTTGLSRDPALLRNDHSSSGSTVSGIHSKRGFTASSFSDLNPNEARLSLKSIAISRDCISLADILIEGTFGKVYCGAIVTDAVRNEAQQVFIKTVTDEAHFDQIDIMLREGCFTLGLKHDNISSIIASCLDHDHHPMLIYPFMNEGNLKKFLQRCKISDVGFQQVLNTQQLVYIAIQVTKAIHFLHRRHIVHGDIAARNCVVDNRLNVQLTDSALSRDLFANEYHCLGDNENRPIKWLALEALVARKFSPASDTWAFGVFLWELMTLGQIPYANVDPFEMATYLKAGYRVTQPVNCPNELFAIMACCWSFSPDERPKFTQMQLCLQDFYTALGQFV